MQPILELGRDAIVAMQQYQTPWLDAWFGSLTWLGGTGYLLLVPLLIWCVDYRLGLRMLVLIVLTLYLNTLLKELILLPRPYSVDPRILSAGEHGYSLPSGHAQLAVMYWGLLASWIARRWFWGVALLMILFIGLSRPYLGVHYPSDIVAGWLLGAATLWIYLQSRSGFDRRSAAVRWGAAAAGLALLLVVNWATVEDVTLYGCTGMLLGVAVAVAAGRQTSGFDAGGALWKRPLRMLLGVALTLPVISSLSRMVDAASEHTALLAFVTMLVLGIWVALLMPQLFNLLRLGAESANRVAGSSVSLGSGPESCR